MDLACSHIGNYSVAAAADMFQASRSFVVRSRKVVAHMGCELARHYLGLIDVKAMRGIVVEQIGEVAKGPGPIGGGAAAEGQIVPKLDVQCMSSRKLVDRSAAFV